MNHALALSRDLPGMSAAQAAHELDAGAQLLLAAFRKQASLTGDGRAAVQAAVMSQVRRYVEANLNQPESFAFERGGCAAIEARHDLPLVRA